jgi:hypothetical protein
MATPSARELKEKVYGQGKSLTASRPNLVQLCEVDFSIPGCLAEKGHFEGRGEPAAW